MAKTEIVKPTNPGMIVSQRPDFIPEADAKLGTEVLSRYVTPPALKIVQKQGADELIAKFSIGTALIMPQQAVLVENDTPFKFVPLFMYPEYLTWTPIESRSKGIPAVIDRSLDPASPLARKATNKDTWSEEITYQGHNLKVRHIEHLCFVCKLVDHPLADALPWFTVSFAKGEHKTGRALSGLIKMRNAPPFACVFEARVCKTPRKNEYGTWHGLDINNPSSGSPWVSGEEYELYKKTHLELQRLHNEGLIKADYEGEDGADAAAETAADEM